MEPDHPRPSKARGAYNRNTPGVPAPFDNNQMAAGQSGHAANRSTNAHFRLEHHSGSVAQQRKAAELDHVTGSKLVLGGNGPGGHMMPAGLYPTSDSMIRGKFPGY